MGNVSTVEKGKNVFIHELFQENNVGFHINNSLEVIPPFKHS